jgi:sulfur carrier protein
MTVVRLNGTELQFADGSTLADVVASLTATHTGIAVALDDAVVPRSRWDATPVFAGARVEVLTAVQGG